MNERIETIPIGYIELPEDARKQILTDLLSLGSLSVPSPEFINGSVNYLHDEGRRISIYFRASMYQINFFSAEDPSQLHYSIAREVLSEIGGEELESDERARDLLARELVKECKSFAAKIIPSSLLQENNKDRILFIITKKDEEAQHLICEINGNFWLDDLLFKHLKKLGGSGRKRAEELSESSKKWMEKFHEDGKLSGLFRMWVAPTVPSYYCRFPKVLAEILWEERVNKLVRKAKENIPALTQRINSSLTKILSPRIERIEDDRKIQMLYEGKVVAATLPAIDPRLIPILTKGAGNLNSIYHHRLIRFECRVGFENWIKKTPDARVLRFERGCSEIVEQLGITSNQAIEVINSLLTAQAHMQFNFDDGSSGNLISLRKFRSKRCNRDDGVEIILGTFLLPHYTFETTKRGRLLTPVPALPPLVSSANYHARQALLQMMVMEEFTEKSVEFAESGSIVINSDKWQKFAKEADLPKTVFEKTLDRWIQDGDDLPGFLIKLDPDRYALGEAYSKETDFLKRQGLRRKERQKGGERSAMHWKMKRKSGKKQ